MGCARVESGGWTVPLRRVEKSGYTAGLEGRDLFQFWQQVFLSERIRGKGRKRRVSVRSWRQVLTHAFVPGRLDRLGSLSPCGAGVAQRSPYGR